MMNGSAKRAHRTIGYLHCAASSLSTLILTINDTYYYNNDNATNDDNISFYRH